MELLKLSMFKLQLRALVSQVHELREKERSASEQLNVLVQKQKQDEEEFGRKLTELQVELALSNDLQRKLQRKVSYLQNDNALFENKQKELKETINNLLQSREEFVKVYEGSTCEMKRSIESRDRKITVLFDKINSHLSLFDSIEKEAFSVKQFVDNAQHVLSEKEEVVAGLKIKLDKISTFEKLFVEKINNLESKLRSNEDELRRKDKIISKLEAQLEAEKISDKSQPRIKELQETLSAKEAVIDNLMSDKKALHFELASLDSFIKKIQDTVTQMNEENRRAFSSMLVRREDCTTIRKTENNRIEDAVQNSRENSPHEASGRGVAENADSPLCQECNSISNPSGESNNFNSCVSESVCSPPRPTCSEPQSDANVQSISGCEAKDNCTTLVHQLDSACSTTQAETT